jgi:superfamily I DNA and/or RNA helicase
MHSEELELLCCYTKPKKPKEKPAENLLKEPKEKSAENSLKKPAEKPVERVFCSSDKRFVFKAKCLLISSQDEETEEIQEKVEIEQNSIQLMKLNISVDFISDSYQIKVMQRGLDEVKKMPVWQVLSGERVAKLPEKADIKFAPDSRLNEEQEQAVKGALGAPELFLIWGPPGTGKTEVIQEIAKQEALLGHKTLISSQSNLAVDNALARLDGLPGVYPFRIAREGYEMEGEDNDKVPFIGTSGLFFLKELVSKLETQKSKSKLQDEFLKRLKKAEKTHIKTRKSDNELREFKQHSELYRKNINVVGATLMETGKTEGSHKNKKNKLCNTTGIKKFDTVIIDEVSKATPPELFIPLSLGGRIILVGDHKQLPPMFKDVSSEDDRTQTEWAEEAGVDESELDVDSTIFERLWDRHKDEANSVRAMLTKQYRMHPKIQALIEPFYTDSEGSLSFGFGEKNKKAIENLTLNNIDFCKNRPTMWIKTANKSWEEKVGTSFKNENEIENVGKLLKKLAKANDKQLSVGVITFYGAQLQELRAQYYGQYKGKFGDGKLIFGTVDRFQGRECDVIICSLVRNNEHRQIGFASKINRINVAFSRARKVLIILGSDKQFCYEGKNKEAKSTYKTIYDKCDKPQPKELD